MQNRYVGDVGDYIKLAILRKLAPGRRLGVAWWFFPDENHNNDGGHREYLARPAEWRLFDPDLYDALLNINKNAERNVRLLEDTALLPNALFARDPVPCRALPFALRPLARQQWVREMKDRFKNADLIFLDPDNGIAPPGLRPTQRRAGKSVLVEDLEELKEKRQTMIVCHHQTRLKGGRQVELEHLAARLRQKGFNVSGALRASPWSPRFFLIINGDEELSSRALSLSQTWSGKICWHPNP